MDKYENKIKAEKSWYSSSPFQVKHFLNSRLFYSPERNAFNYIFPKKQLSLFINQIVKANGLKNPSILIAPIRTGNDIQYIRQLSGTISGIDISHEAIDRIVDDTVERYIGDMKNMAIFPDNQFDIILVSLFFHHYVQYGFDDYLKEAYRVLKPGGCFFSLEPSSLHPACWISRSAKALFGNITGLVEGEKPFYPPKLSNAMKRCKFNDVQVWGASFSHNRIPIWIARINNVVSLPMLKFPIVKYFAWMCLFYGRK